MITYLQKYNQLPQELRAKISTPEVLGAIAELEKGHNVNLASVVMRVMVRDIALLDLNKYFVFEYNLDGRHAEQLVEELKTRVFAGVADYLGFKAGELPASSGDELDKWAKERASEAAVRSSNFFFSPEDEEEVKILTKTLEQAGEQVEVTAERVEEAISGVITSAKINLSSEDLVNRLRSVLKTYLRGTRNKIDAKLALMRPVSSGGLELDERSIDGIMAAAENEKLKLKQAEKIKPPVKMKLPEDAPAKKTEIVKDLSGSADPAYDFSKLAAKPKNEQQNGKGTAPVILPPAVNLKTDSAVRQKPPEKAAVIDLKKKEEPALPLAGGIPTPKTVGAFKPIAETPAPIIRPMAPAPVIDKPKETAAPGRISMAQARSEASLPGKTRMDDIKYVPKTKLTGPVDELGEMSLIDFRRLSDDPAVAAASIKGKIKLLEDDNYSQRLLGIKAWRESPLYKLYLAIGQESIGEHKSIETVIVDRLKANAEYLTQEEFNAIMDLNKDLRF
ncbi:MAG: hypothetical protein V1867_07865 [Candidatus Falkowbacteria bacterium]